ncbi:hypothetical protein D3C85_1817550 [compost metagenome]
MDGVEAGVRPQRQQAAAVIIAQGTYMVLLHPAASVVLVRQEQQHRRLERRDFIMCQCLAGQPALQHSIESSLVGLTV